MELPSFPQSVFSPFCFPSYHTQSGLTNSSQYSALSVLWLEFSLTIAGIFIIISFSASHVESGFPFFLMSGRCKFISGCGEAWYRAWFGSKRPWVQIPPLGPRKIPRAAMVLGIFHTLFCRVFPFVFPLQPRYPLDKRLQPLCAGFLHLLGDVPIHIERKCRCGVPQV